MSRVMEQLNAQRSGETITEYRVRNGTNMVPFLKLKFLCFNHPRSAPVHQGGWNGPAKTRIIEGDYVCPKGKMTHRYHMEICPDGYCELPDTELNRAKLRKQITKRTVKRKQKVYYKDERGQVKSKIEEVTETFEPAFELLEPVNLKNKAPIDDVNIADENPIEAIMKENEKLKEKFRKIKADKAPNNPGSPKPLE